MKAKKWLDKYLYDPTYSQALPFPKFSEKTVTLNYQLKNNYFFEKEIKTFTIKKSQRREVVELKQIMWIRTWIMGLPRIWTKGFPSNRDEANRAGIIPTTRLRNLETRPI